MATSSSSVPPQHQVFINFRGRDIRRGFVSHLVKALQRSQINVYMDEFEDRGEHLETLFKRIEESRIALAIFSKNYTESDWCLREVEKMNDCMKKGKLVVIPIFYKLQPSTVRDLKGRFGNKFWGLVKGDETKKKLEEGLKSIPNLFGITVDENRYCLNVLHSSYGIVDIFSGRESLGIYFAHLYFSNEGRTVDEIVNAVIKVLYKISCVESQNVSADPIVNSNAGTSSRGKKHKAFGNEQRLKELEEKLDRDKYKRTRIIGVIGMPGIGKTTLLKELFEKWKPKFSRYMFVDQIRVNAKGDGLECMSQMLLEGLLPTVKDPQISNGEDPYERYTDQLLECKVLVILDDVSERKQIQTLLARRDWISEGSRIVIATSDMSLTKDLVDDTYMVQNLNHRDSSELFHFHAFDDVQANPPEKDFVKLSEEFVHFAKGHPLALKVLGKELYGQDIPRWESTLKKLAQSSNPHIESVFQESYNELSPEQKDAFLDIACFRSHDVDYVESLLASSTSAVEALANKCLINICDGRVEMHDLLYTFSRELDPKASTQTGNKYRRLWLHQDIIKEDKVNALQNNMYPRNVRGIFLDLSEVKGELCLNLKHLENMCNLRYLKFYNSHCHECKTTKNINTPDGIKLPLKEIRCLHWLNYPLEELPHDFEPINLVDLKLPFSEIKQLWKDDKDTPFLKWVDLNHSIKLCSLSGLSKAENLQRLNLEGCTTLKTFPDDIGKMNMLAFLNLKGCTSLESLPEMNLHSLKTLTLSGCSNFKEFPLISENLETLYIDGTSISQLPTDMEKLQRLVVLNMKDCKMLKEISDRVGELKTLQELILSDCLNLKIFPEIKMSSLKILLLDGTAIEVMPQLPTLQYLCLSRNEKLSRLPIGICQLSQLKWLDLKYCTNLTSVPEFPPNLHCLDAQGCSSLKTISKPLARIMPTEQNHSTFIFTNCMNLEHAAKKEIISYAQRKCQLLSYAHKRYNGGLVSESLFSTCFPGCEVPSWFCHETVGSELEVKLLPHWHDQKLAGIALCAVVSCLDRQEQISRLSVTCTFKVKDEDKTWVPFTCPVGSWTRHKDGKDKIESDHVFIGYTSCPHTMKFPEDGSSDKCNLNEASLKFTVTGGISENKNEKFKVLKCGLSLVYARDKNKHSCHEAKYDMPVDKGLTKEETKKRKKRKR